MREIDLKRLLSNSDLVDEKIQLFINNNIILKADYPESEIIGHIAKAEHNLNFVDTITDNYNDWILIVCYYASYHAALALTLTKGSFSKSHDATLCLLIKHFYNHELSREEIELLNLFDADDLLFYVQSKLERENASYTSRIKFDDFLVREIHLKTKMFINKVSQ